MRVEEIKTGTPGVTENLKLPEQTVDRQERKTAGAAAAVNGGQAAGRLFTRDELALAVEQLNKTMRAYNTELHFEIHEKSGEIMVKVMNSESDAVIREIPPEKVLNIVAYFKEMLGIVIDRMI